VGVYKFIGLVELNGVAEQAAVSSNQQKEGIDANVSGETRSARTPPGEGERRAQRGYTHQYHSAAVAIYAGLDRGILRWIGLADRSAGIADDVVLGYDNVVIGHQFKRSSDPAPFRLHPLLCGANGLLSGLVDAWRELHDSCPGLTIKIRVVVTDTPSKNDSLTTSAGTTSEFINDWHRNPGRSLADWRTTSWRTFIEDLLKVSGLGEQEFNELFTHLELRHGEQPSFLQLYEINHKAEPLIEEIALLLPKLVAKLPAKDRWTTSELLQELGWRSVAQRHLHQFPLGSATQRNPVTEAQIQQMLKTVCSGYLSLVGPPGTGKSTLLQVALQTEPSLIIVRYLAFVPNASQGVGRGEADDFLTDVISALRDSGLRGVKYKCESTFEKREEFEILLLAASTRFEQHGVKTLIAIDGLDHVSREELPERSFLKELPLPNAIPNGVLVLLSTQRVNLPDIPLAVIAQASDSSRSTAIAPLPLPAIAAMADQLTLPAEIARTRIYELGKGHPLATRYLLEALLTANDSGKQKLLQDGFDYSGDIEDVYRSAWRWIESDGEAVEVMGLIARAEAPVALQHLAQVVSEASVQHAYDKTSHLLARDPKRCSVFHNSFRLFILRQPRIRLGEPDPHYSRHLYLKLVELARCAPTHSPQNDLELRYLIRAGEHSDVLRIAKPSHFRDQFIAGRSTVEIQNDIRLAFQSLKVIADPTAVFSLVLSADEIHRRSSTLDESSDVVEALISLRDLDNAECFVEDSGGDAYPVIKAWLAAGNFERAHSLFARNDPLHDLSKITAILAIHHNDALIKWAQHVVYFRKPHEISAAIQKFIETARINNEPSWDYDPADVSAELRLIAALSLVAINPQIDLKQVIADFSLTSKDECLLATTSALALISEESINTGLATLSQLATEPRSLEGLSPRVRRRAALAAARRGELETARVFIAGVAVPSVAMLDAEINYDASRPLVKAVIEYAELTTFLSAIRAEVPSSKKSVLFPLQQFAEQTGQLAARSQSAAKSIPAGEIGRNAYAFLKYAARANAGNAGEYLAMSQLNLAVPIVIESLLRSSARIGPKEFHETVKQIDRAIETECKDKLRFRALLILIAELLARCQGNSIQAKRRLDDLVDIHGENTPSEYINDRAKLISSYARIGETARAVELLSQLRHETLGYSLRAKKDPQYAFWRTLLVEANRFDPAASRERIEILTRQSIGMMETEGRDAAYRIAHTLVVEASIESAEFGWAIANQLLESDLIDFPTLVDAIMLGRVRHRPDLIASWIEVWVNLTLPFYREPYYRDSHEGDFIREVVTACSSSNLKAVADRLAHCISISAQLDVRHGLIRVLATALASRNVSTPLVEEVFDRIANEYQRPKRGGSTPERYDDITSMEELVQVLAREIEEDPTLASYNAAHAFSRLLPTSTLDRAVEIFESNSNINSDSRARFDLVELAIAKGNITEALRLTNNFSLVSRDDATWAWYMGGARLRLFKASVCLKGDEARVMAYTDFVSQLASRAENVTMLLPEVDDIWSVIAKQPAWAEMWQYLQEQLTTTRDHRMGQSLTGIDHIDDQELIARLLELVVVLPVNEIQWHASNCALSLAKDGSESFCSLIRRLITTGSEDTIIVALRLLIAAGEQPLPEDFRSTVIRLGNHDDLAIRQYAAIIARWWGYNIMRSGDALPTSYRLVLSSAPPPRANEQLRHYEFGPPIAIDPELWCGPFSQVIKLISKHGVPEENIRMRVTTLIDSWGGVQAFGNESSQRLNNKLKRIGLRLAYFHPHILAGAQALRHVAGEFERAGILIEPNEINLVLDFLTPILATVGMNVSPRPTIIRQPTAHESFMRDAEIEQWLANVEQDVLLPTVEPLVQTILAEFTRYEFKSLSTTFTWSRALLPMISFEADDSPLQAYYSMPISVFAHGEIKPTSRRPALVRRISRSQLPVRPEFEFALDPQLVEKLGWSPIDPDRAKWVARNGKDVAHICTWRDAGPDGDMNSDCLWGEGTIVTLTPHGLLELKAVVGTLSVGICAERGIFKESNDERTRAAISSVVLSN
jgi:hypothetical protein